MCTWRQIHFRHVEAEGKPSKKSKKGGAKGSVATLKESKKLGRVSQGSYPRKSILREQGKLGSKHTVKFSKGTWHQIKIRERKGPSRGIIKKCAPHERSPCAPKLGERSHEDTLHPRNVRPQGSVGFGEKMYKLKIQTERRSILLLKQRWCRHLLQRDKRSTNL